MEKILAAADGFAGLLAFSLGVINLNYLIIPI
jgi:hypothetical protein